MNDIDLYIDNKEELRAVIEQIGAEYPEGHRLRKMVEKIIKRYRSEMSLITFRAGNKADELTVDQLELYQIPFALSHEARCLNEKYGYLGYHLMKFHKMAMTPASVKSLIEILLKSAWEAAHEVFRQTKEFHGKLDVERDPMTGKIRNKLPDDKFTNFGTLINIKKVR
ncbi:MAG TPA: hypothetical protein DD381_05475 [Lentisphaeria bacterium]|nr:MAG: hypothetical protein A2X47_06985 [Lentisphaerae bacterium GWF2_38_69]HBM15781.1 hypothetical protein [Lentisphaeria bacterium]